MKHYNILRDCRQHRNSLHNAVQAVAHMHTSPWPPDGNSSKPGTDLPDHSLLQQASVIT